MNFIDQVIGTADQALRVLAAPAQASRPYPTIASAEISAEDRSASARLMRVNHCGEVCAQALYSGQLLFARGEKTREILEHARQEEVDHLAWCEKRISDLGGRTSVLNPVFYAGSFTLGAASALVGDATSLAFLTETERQVEAHLTDHLARLPDSDAESRSVLEQMRADEIRHGQTGQSLGQAELPEPVKLVMRAVSKLMTFTTERV
jgi:3-demethoxyubiquinol 3-hydroxylase